jgi:hypothetical protein
MADIARRIKLYQQAFQLAFEHVADDSALSGRPDFGKQLHDIVRHEIAVGVSDPVAIAAAAVRELEARGGAHK